jgi:hypothetical protein
MSKSSDRNSDKVDDIKNSNGSLKDITKHSEASLRAKSQMSASNQQSKKTTSHKVSEK